MWNKADDNPTADGNIRSDEAFAGVSRAAATIFNYNDRVCMEKIDIVIDALAGKHGPLVREKAELVVKVAADQITRAIFRVPDCASEAGSPNAFSAGGHVTRGEQLIPGARDREHFVPLSIIQHLRLRYEDDF